MSAVVWAASYTGERSQDGKSSPCDEQAISRSGETTWCLPMSGASPRKAPSGRMDAISAETGALHDPPPPTEATPMRGAAHGRTGTMSRVRRPSCRRICLVPEHRLGMAAITSIGSDTAGSRLLLVVESSRATFLTSSARCSTWLNRKRQADGLLEWARRQLIAERLTSKWSRRG
jgi:hypothetical protein